jgi:urease accessory protein UreF
MTGYKPAPRQTAEEILGNVNLLAEQIGSAEGLAALTQEANSRTFQRVTDLPSLRQFLRDYHARILTPLELPAIQQAYQHANCYEVRELIDLDRRIANEPLLQCFAAASRQVGKTQLKRLRPLRDQRLLQRYLAAVQSGSAHGWHSVVYGLILSLYSLPLRPGLLSYAQQTTRGFIYSSARRLSLSEIECDSLIAEACFGLPAAVDQVLAAGVGEGKLSVLP